MTEKEKMLKQMLHDANDAKELSDDRARAKDLCYDYNQLCPSDEEGKQKLMKKLLVEVKGAL
jgi:maltose O-acetyltransferase